MRRVGLFVVILTLIFGTLAAGDASEDLCWTTTGGANTATCDVPGEQLDVSFSAFEPTMGSDEEGNLFFATTPGSGVAVGFAASIAGSFDGGATWTDIDPNIGGVHTPPETNDPYAYVDPGTGRVFAFHMGPILTCSVLSWTDDKGASWETSPIGCAPTGVWDHQTMVAARPVDGVTMLGDYPNVLVQCVNAIYAAECGRSLDGGLTWQHTVPVHINDNPATKTVESGTLTSCGAQHGHLAADDAGNLYLPTSNCGRSPQVFISRDSGLTWEQNIIADSPMEFEDPAIAVDEAGTIHAVWPTEAGAILYAKSTDSARSWSEPIRVTPDHVTGKMPTMVAGDEGRIAFAFIGTDDYGPDGYLAEPYDDETDEGWFAEDIEIGGWISYSTDAHTDSPTFTTIEATGNDPLMRGDKCNRDPGDRCGVIVDFIGSTVTPDGRVFGAVIDGCREECSAESGDDVTGSGKGQGVVITIPGLDLCELTCPRFPVGAGQAIDSGLVGVAPTSFGGRLVLPNLDTLVQWNSPTNPFTVAERIEMRRAYNSAR